MIQPTAQLWITKTNVKSGAAMHHLVEALLSVEEKQSEEKIASLIRGLRGELRERSGNDKGKIANELMKRLKDINLVK